MLTNWCGYVVYNCLCTILSRRPLNITVGWLILLEFLPQLLLWKKLLVRLIKENVGKTWLYTSVSSCERQIRFQNINTFFMALTLMTAVGQPLPLLKI